MHSSSIVPKVKKRLQSSLGLIHDKTDVFGVANQNKQNIQSQNLYDHAWAVFKSHTVTLEGQKMHDRIIDSAADQPYALEIRYHHKCWLKYVWKFQKVSEDDKLLQIQSSEVQTMFFDHT